MKYNIVTLENDTKDVLRKNCKPVTSGSPRYWNDLINQMANLMVDSGGCGIAAPQVGVNRRLFLAILNGNEIEVFINPVIQKFSEETETKSEGCLSVPGKMGDVKRYKEIEVGYFNGKKYIKQTFSGLNARIIQHEYDHLKGILYTDKAENIRDREQEEEKCHT